MAITQWSSAVVAQTIRSNVGHVAAAATGAFVGGGLGWSYVGIAGSVVGALVGLPAVATTVAAVAGASVFGTLGGLAGGALAAEGSSFFVSPREAAAELEKR